MRKAAKFVYALKKLKRILLFLLATAKEAAGSFTLDALKLGSTAKSRRRSKVLFKATISQNLNVKYANSLSLRSSSTKIKIWR